MDIKVHALHGMIGLPQDWECLQSFLGKENLICYDLWKNSYSNFREWVDCFYKSADLSSDKKHCLMGYSLGGRLALHALAMRPEVWASAVIISAHPGLTSLEERRKRVQEDELWAKRFETVPWEELMKMWNEQSIFNNNQCPRDENQYERKKLAEALRVWSRGRQEDLREVIHDLPFPILWIVGKEDKAYVKVAQSITFSHPQSKVWIVENAGHRVPWEQEKIFKEKIQDFLLEPVQNQFWRKML